MQPRIPTRVQSKLFAYVVAACLLITCSPVQSSLFANAVDIPRALEQDQLSQLDSPLLSNVDPVVLNHDNPGEQSDGGYAPDFAYFARNLLGRQAGEVTQLKNDQKADRDIAPETTVYFVLEQSQLKARSFEHPSSHALDARDPDAISNDSHKGGASVNEALETTDAEGRIQARQTSNSTIWVSANTCKQPMPGNNASSTGAPQLRLYVSTSVDNQKPGPDSTENLVTDREGIPFDGGYVSFEVNTTSDVYIGVSAPKLDEDWFGSWLFEVSASSEGSYHSYNRTNPFLFMVDTDSESTLFITYALANSNDKEVVEKWNNSNPFSMYAFPAGRSPVTGMENSVCALKQQFNSTNNITVDTSITTKFGSGFPKSQFNVHNLSNAQMYNGYLVVEGNQETVDLPGVGRVHGGGKVFQQFNWTTKADDSCQVLTDLEFCDTVAYAVPSSPDFKYNDDKLKALYDDQAKAYWKNFSNSLDQIACDAPSTAQYSLARNCTNCRDDYKAWLCSVLIPRCEDWTATDPWLQPRNINANFSDGSIPFANNMSAEFNATTRSRFGYSKSRNPMIDQEIKPGPYKEMLPCEDLCFDIVRSCPATLGFACPNPPARDLQYGQRDPTGNVLTCSFPGAVVKLNVQGSATSPSVTSGGIALVSSMLLAMIVISWGTVSSPCTQNLADPREDIRHPIVLLILRCQSPLTHAHAATSAALPDDLSLGRLAPATKTSGHSSGVMAEITGPRPLNTTRAANAHRVHSSCDRCRSRKTKCIDPIPGPCRYCARTGATCTIATPRRKRPFYHVTEEEYQLSIGILSQVFHGQQLNLESLRKISKAIKDGSLVVPTLNADTYIQPNQPTPEDEDEGDADTPGEWSVDVDGTVDSDNLHEPLGSMMKDSKGVLRYVGAQSDIPFNGAVANFCRPTRNPAIIPPAKVGAYPPKEEKKEKEDVFWLPPKELCFHYVKRYREEVHCMYWLYPEAQLLQRIEDTYAWYETKPPSFKIKREHSDTPTPPPRSGQKPSVSWICSIYAMCAIGAVPRGLTESSPSPGPPTDHRASTSEDYLALVKELKWKVEDSADIDSIRALAISALALENALSRVTAYLYIGTAIEIAWSLGLHRNQQPASGLEEEREQNRRIWWTLTTLDLEIGLRGGNPTLVDDRFLEITTSLPLERIRNEPVKAEFLGIYTPHKWLATFVQLGDFKREVIRDIYTERVSKSISFSNVNDKLLRLRKWHANLPPHLRHEAYETAPEFHRRAITVLHLHYWSTWILITRPFLLYLILKRTELDQKSTIAHEKMAKAAVGAARMSVDIFRLMIRDRSISSLTTFDSTAVLRCITIFMCAFGYYQTDDFKQDANTCIEIARSMEQIGFARMIVAETPLHIQNLGMSLQPQPSFPHESHMADAQTIADLWHMQQLTSLQSQQVLSLVNDDPDALDPNSHHLATDELPEVFFYERRYPGYGQQWQ